MLEKTQFPISLEMWFGKMAFIVSMEQSTDNL